MVDARYAALRARLPGLPATLTRDRAAGDLWRDPALVFGQTCWGPLGAGLLAHLRVLAQPDYTDVPGGQGPLYRSALVARGGGAVPPPDRAGAVLPALSGRFAYNERGSLSGWLAVVADGGDPAGWSAGLVETGSHRASVQAVAQGRADLAAIDCRSWALALAHEPAAAGLVVVGWTAARPGLPYVTAKSTKPGLTLALRAALLDMGCHPATKGL